jgi:hypothetical protein
MDFWCALWFWPIDDADKLPNRSDFLFCIEFILDNSVIKTSSPNYKHETYAKDLESITRNDEGLTKNIFNLPLNVLQSVSIDELCSLDPALTVARKVAREQHFFQWDLDFANLFKKNGGFDLIIGNPPWIKLGWEEKWVLSEKNPIFVVRDFDATKIKTSQERTNALKDKTTYAAYFSEYQTMKGSLNFLSANQNYPDLKGQTPNLYKCFLPQAWLYQKEDGISAFVHPDGIYDASNGGAFRKKLYSRLRKHFQFTNEELLFSDVGDHKRFSLNVYGAPKSEISFQSINNLYVTNTIDQSYGSSSSISSIDEGIKDSNDNWNTSGYPKRILNIKKDELSLFAKLYDGNEIWEEAKLANIHNSDLFSVLKCFAKQKTLKSENIQIFYSTLWSETADQKNGIIKNNSHFPKSALDMIVSGPNFNVSSPLSKCARRLCIVNSDYESIDLTKIPLDYLPRCKYAPALSDDEYVKKTPDTQWGDKYIDDYRIFVRRMVALGNVRTLISAIAAPKIGHINVVFGIRLDNKIDLVMLQGLMSSLPLDFFIRTANKDGIDRNFIQGFPFFKKNNNILVRSLLLNCITSHYCSLFSEVWDDGFKSISWTKEDPRLDNSKFSNLTGTFTWDTPLRTDYERRQALIELDVLVAKLLGMTLEELKLIYRIYFYVMKSNEEDTFYDRNGRIVFTGASLSGLGYSRSEWNEIKDKTSGTFTRTIEDDTLSGGKVKRYIEYVAPFDRCDREKDYEIAWKFFEKLM